MKQLEIKFMFHHVKEATALVLVYVVRGFYFIKDVYLLIELRKITSPLAKSSIYSGRGFKVLAVSVGMAYLRGQFIIDRWGTSRLTGSLKSQILVSFIIFRRNWHFQGS